MPLPQTAYASMLDAAPDAILGVDTSGVIVYMNEQSARLFGYPHEELLGQPVEILVPEMSRAVHPRRRAEYVHDPRPRPMGAGMELTARRRDGSVFPAEISLSTIIGAEGMIVCAAVRDVTERLELQAERERLRATAASERLEAQLHQAQRLESLGQLAGGVAHDFNNLLGAITNYAAFVIQDLGAMRAAGAVVDRPIHDAEQIAKAAERGAALTRQLLAFGRREVVRPEVLDLDDVIRGVEQLLRRTIGEHVDLVTHLVEDPVPMIVADRGRLEQVLVNLAVNARDAMPGGGTLTIETQVIDVDEVVARAFAGLQPGPGVMLRVGDSGAGMSEDVRTRAFEPFFTTKPKGEGTGLGLATVYGIVTQAGGVANLYSEIGMGTTFTALFPRSLEAPTPAAPPEVEAVHHRSGETILLVEDELAIREVAQRILEQAGYRVLTAPTAPDAVAMVRGLARDGSAALDLVVTDVVMPQMLGTEVAERIAALRPGVRVLFMSGYARPVLSSQGTLEPGMHLIEKPFTAATLLDRVRAVLDE